jgi:hypothetical protein
LVREIASEAYIAMVKPLIYIIIVYMTYDIFVKTKRWKIYKYGVIALLIIVLSIHCVSMSHKLIKIWVTQNELNNAGINVIDLSYGLVGHSGNFQFRPPLSGILPAWSDNR